MTRPVWYLWELPPEFANLYQFTFRRIEPSEYSVGSCALGAIFQRSWASPKRLKKRKRKKFGPPRVPPSLLHCTRFCTLNLFPSATTLFGRNLISPNLQLIHSHSSIKVCAFIKHQFQGIGSNGRPGTVESKYL